MIRALAIVLLVAVAGCCPCREVGVTTTTSMRDSIYVSHYDTVHIVQRDTILSARLEHSSQRRELMTQHSELSNSYCVSTADVDDEGVLTHTLDTRDSALLPFRTIEVKRIIRDTVFRDMNESKDTKETRIVAKKRTWWSTTKDILLLVLAGVLLWQNRKLLLRLLGVIRI